MPGRRLTAKEASSALARLQEIDEDNTRWIHGIVRERGWPGASLVGEDGATAAWLLVQHADHDPGFQRECLELLEQSVEQGEASARDLAYLTDRVLRHEGRPQRYGTQFQFGPNGFEPQPLEDPERVNERRLAVGLGTLDEYRELMQRHYGGAAGRE